MERVKMIASHLDDVETDTLQLHIDDASQELSHYTLEPGDRERAERYLAAHYATLDVRRAQSESVGDLSVSYSEQLQKGLASTAYGQEVQRILKRGRTDFAVLP